MILLPWHLGEMQEENRKPWQKWTAAMSSSLGGAGPWDRSGDIEKRTLLNAVLLYRIVLFLTPVSRLMWKWPWEQTAGNNPDKQAAMMLCVGESQRFLQKRSSPCGRWLSQGNGVQLYLQLSFPKWVWCIRIPWGTGQILVRVELCGLQNLMD